MTHSLDLREDLGEMQKQIARWLQDGHSHNLLHHIGYASNDAVMNRLTLRFAGKDEWMHENEFIEEDPPTFSRQHKIKPDQRLTGVSLSTSYNDGSYPVLIHLHYEADEGGKWEKQIQMEQAEAPDELQENIKEVKSFSLAPNELIYGFDLFTYNYDVLMNIKIKTVVF